MGIFTETESLRNAHLAAANTHRVDSRALAATLRWADAAAARHDYDEALHWLDTVAAMRDELPDGYAAKRAIWQNARHSRRLSRRRRQTRTSP